MPSQTLLDVLEEHVNLQGDRVVYTFLHSDDSRSSLTFRDLSQRAKAVARGLLQHATPGDRALLAYPPGLAFIEAFLGCLYAGIIAVPVYPPRKNRNAGRVLAIAHDCNPQLLLCAAETRENLLGDFAAAVRGAKVVATDELDLTGRNGVTLPANTAGHLAFLQYTSGSTAAPRGVMITHGNIVANERLIQRYFKFDSTSVMVSWLPMFHDMGLIGGVLAPLFVGFPAVLMPPARFLREPVRWLEAVTEFRGTCTGAPNFAYDLCCRKINAEQKQRLDLSSLRIAYNGAEPVRAETLTAFSAAFAACGFRAEACFPCYGMAETTLLVSGGPPLTPTSVLTFETEALESHRLVPLVDGAAPVDGAALVGCGQITPEFDARIVQPETGQPTAADEVGEIWVQGASVADGYWKRPDETQAAFRARLPDDDRYWFRTGDYGFLRDGELFITGRLKDLIIIRGRNIYPQDIEACVYETLALEAPNSVAAVQIDRDGEPGLGVIIEATRLMYQQSKRWSSANDATDGADRLGFRQQMWLLRQRVNQQFDVSLSYLAFVKPGEFPRTSSGKVMRSRCRQDFVSGTAEYLALPTATTRFVNDEIEVRS